MREMQGICYGGEYICQKIESFKSCRVNFNLCKLKELIRRFGDPK